MYIAVLGRQSKISLAELESIFGASNISPLSSSLALVKAKTFNLNRLGGTIKAGQVLETPLLDYLRALPPGKITLGFSDYSKKATARSSQTHALKLKSILKRQGRSVRIVPNNSDAALSSATSHHNQLGEKTNHIEIIQYEKYTVISIGTQNITSYAKRDQARPARDAFVGMLPPKLAQILINISTGLETTGRLLDPFCGTGTILQEALLMGYFAYGTDLSEKMVSYSEKNLDWLKMPDEAKNYFLEVGDATKHKWSKPINFIASEIYLGQPFSAPPSDIKLKEVKFTTKAIFLSFLKNLAPQIKPGTPLALALPAWKRPSGEFSHLEILDEIKKLGYNVHQFKHATPSELLYHRENQVVARQIILLNKV